MPVFLRTKNGLVKEYPVGSPYTKDPTLSKCGETGCEHLDCAIGYAKEMVSLIRLILAVIVLMTCSFIFIALLVVYSHWPGIFDRGFWIDNVMGLVFIFLIFSFILYCWYSQKQAKKSLEELLEFQERGTVNNLPARQVSAKAAEEEQRSV